MKLGIRMESEITSPCRVTPRKMILDFSAAAVMREILSTIRKNRQDLESK